MTRLVGERTWMVNGNGVSIGCAAAEKLRLSIANPWALPVASAISQTSQSAAPGAQLVMTWLKMPRLVGLSNAVPSTAAPPTAAGMVGKPTFKTGQNAVALVENI